MTGTTTTPATMITAPADLNIYEVPRFRRILRDAIEHGSADLVIADLTGVEFTDAVGCGVLVAAQRLAESRGRRLGVACDREPVLRLFLVLGLTKHFDIRDSVEAFAVASPAEDETAAVTAGEEQTSA
ncbi:MAG TPA: STAS domain-containing protein [Streptosporangiaceae bacterium]|nr:STAS domain-containing protein [Streptosporangiaceae bacterium]